MSSTAERDVAPILRRAVQRLSRRLRTERPPDGLAVLPLSLLAQIMDNGPQTAGALARSTRTTPQALTRPLETLARLELVERTPHPTDGRQHILNITYKGWAALATDAAPRDAWLDEAMGALLTGAERDLLVVAAGLIARLAEYEGER